MLPKIAIVGRPNVGKSSIMNMLAGRKVSITDDTPGTTRDRVSAEVLLDPGIEGQHPMLCEIIDTGGYGVYVASGRRIDDAGKDLSALTKDIEGQIAKAVQNADLILFVVDAQAGVTAMDETVARLLRQGGLGAIDEKGRTNSPAARKVVMLANKCDGPRWEAHAAEAAGLGFGEPLMCSAKNNYMRRELVERLYELVLPTFKKIKKAKKDGDIPAEMKLAIVGKRNAGKSTLVNTLAGEDRVIVSEIAGTTRDAIDVRFDFGGRSMVAIDTAGLRRKKSFADRIEWWALERMQQAIDRSDVALLMVDATDPISHVDHQVAHMLTRTYKPCAIVVNKWDLVQGKAVAGGKKAQKVTPEHYETYLRQNLKSLWYAPIAFISANKNTNVAETIDLAFEMHEQSSTRVTTGKLNRIVRAIIDEHKPSSKTGLMAKVYYVAQINTNPPTIVLVVNQPVMYTPAYTRFLLNRLREELPFSEIPIKLLIRDRKRHEQIIARRGEQGTADNEAGTLELELMPAESYFDEPSQGKARAASKPVLQPDPDDEEPVLSEADAVAAFSDAPVQRKAAPFNPKKPRPAAMEAKARSKKRATKGRTAN